MSEFRSKFLPEFLSKIQQVYREGYLKLQM
jgi:hypothetical protein